MKTTSLPSPKPRLTRPDALWYRFYAMFSDEFAERVFALAGLGRGETVFDPWLGVGTTVAAAAKFGLRSIGVDVNPVMTTISLGRFLPRADALKAISCLPSSLPQDLECDSDDPLVAWFHPETANAIRTWESFFRLGFPADRRPEESAFLLTALFETAKTLAARFRSKNPTWVKQPPRNRRRKVSAGRVASKLIEVAKQKAELSLQASPDFRPIIKNAASRSTGVRSSSVDFVLTSPPYCTRIDYAVTTRVELAVLGFRKGGVAQLRHQSMGTSTIRGAIFEVKQEWGQTCLSLLRAIKMHSSKASATYYYKTHLQYFADLYDSIREINRCVRAGARVVLVLQDSYYKEVHTNLQRIMTEMAAGFNWRLTNQFDYQVKRTLRSVNPASKRYGAGSKAVESVLWFQTAHR
jgi:DNA modification methylase